MSALDRWYRLQGSPFGRNAATASGTGTPQMNGFAAGQNQLAEAYRQGTRVLRRASRRGDPRAAVAEIELREKAMQSGFNPSGIIDHETKNRNLGNTADRMLGEEAAMNRGTSALSSAAFNTPDVADQPLGPTAPTSNEALVSAAGMFDLQPGNESRLGYRRAIDRSLGSVTNAGEVDALRAQAADAGVSEEAFNNRARWWATKRPRRF